ncbi:MAG TPA: helix-turn-helix domain-containing protein [Candidatus Acidoferrales bacterium]|nr:helix-turn-helix domain-containing protein [Candidatus Acidoferrales bacterium]
MREQSFFQTTRGRIVRSLKTHRTRTAAQLAQEHGVTQNAVRQHLSRLGRDGLVAERAERLGRTKPTLVYSLTEEGERLFPQRYQLLLSVLMDELSREEGPARLKELFSNIGRRSAQRHAGRFAGKDLPGVVAELASFLRERGVVVEYERSGDGFTFREYNCPFKENVSTHPEICAMVHTLMEQVLPEKPRQTASIAAGDGRCEFELGTVAAPKAAVAKVPALSGEL